MSPPSMRSRKPRDVILIETGKADRGDAVLQIGPHVRIERRMSMRLDQSGDDGLARRACQYPASGALEPVRSRPGICDARRRRCTTIELLDRRPRRFRRSGRRPQGPVRLRRITAPPSTATSPASQMRRSPLRAVGRARSGGCDNGCHARRVTSRHGGAASRRCDPNCHAQRPAKTQPPIAAATLLSAFARARCAAGSLMLRHRHQQLIGVGMEGRREDFLDVARPPSDGRGTARRRDRPGPHDREIVRDEQHREMVLAAAAAAAAPARWPARIRRGRENLVAQEQLRIRPRARARWRRAGARRPRADRDSARRSSLRAAHPRARAATCASDGRAGRDRRTSRAAAPEWRRSARADSAKRPDSGKCTGCAGEARASAADQARQRLAFEPDAARLAAQGGR